MLKKFLIKLKILFLKINKADLIVNRYEKTALSIIMPSYAYINWGKYLAGCGDMKGAIEKFQTSIAMAQQIPEAYINLGLVYANLKEYKEAAKNFRKAIRLDKNSAKAYSLLASVMIEDGMAKEAQKLFEKSVKLEPRESDTYLNWAVSLLKLKKIDEAMEKFKLALFYNPTNFMASFMWGIALFENKKYDEAIKQFEYSLSFNSSDFSALYYLSCCYLKKGLYKKAIEPAKKSLLLNAYNLDTYLLLSEVYLKMNNKEKCLKCFDDAIKNGLHSLKLTLSQGIAMKHFKMFEVAKERFLQVMLKEPNNLIAMYNLAVCELCLNNEDAGYNILLNVVDKNSNHVDAIYNIGIYHLKHRQFEEAISHLQKVLEISPNAIPNVYFDIANCYTALEDFEKAIKFFNKNIEYYPNHIESYINLSTVYMDCDNFVEAQRKIRTAYKYDKNNVFVNFTYAIIHLEAKLYKEALEKFEYVLSKTPQNKGAFYGMLECLINLNNPQKAIEYIEKDGDIENEELMHFYVNAYVKLACIEPSYYNIEKAREIISKAKDKFPNLEEKEEVLNSLSESEIKTGE